MKFPWELIKNAEILQRFLTSWFSGSGVRSRRLQYKVVHRWMPRAMDAYSSRVGTIGWWSCPDLSHIRTLLPTRKNVWLGGTCRVCPRGWRFICGLERGEGWRKGEGPLSLDLPPRLYFLLEAPSSNGQATHSFLGFTLCNSPEFRINLF